MSVTSVWVIRGSDTVTNRMETTDKGPANPVSTHSWLTGCMLVLLLTTAFVIEGFCVAK